MRVMWQLCLLIALTVTLTTGCKGAVWEDGQTSPLAAAPTSPLATPTPSLPQPQPSATPAPSPSPSPSSSRPTPAAIASPTRSPQVEAAVEEARTILAERLGVPTQQVELVYVEAAEWPDASLGCPEPGKMYAQVVTPGYRVVLEVRNRWYELHTDLSARQVVTCQGPVVGERVSLRRARAQEEVVAVARQHLAERLDVPLETIQVMRVEETGWGDEALGCPRPPGNYPDRAYPGPTTGYRIVLAVEGVQYEYHSGMAWLIFCRRIGE